MPYKYHHMKVWHDSADIVKLCYDLISESADPQDFYFFNQMKRASTSICFNLAEGSGAGSDKLMRRHVNIAIGSAFELANQLEIGVKINHWSTEQTRPLLNALDEVIKQLYGLKRHLSRSIDDDANGGK